MILTNGAPCRLAGAGLPMQPSRSTRLRDAGGVPGSGEEHVSREGRADTRIRVGAGVAAGGRRGCLCPFPAARRRRAWWLLRHEWSTSSTSAVSCCSSPNAAIRSDRIGSNGLLLRHQRADPSEYRSAARCESMPPDASPHALFVLECVVLVRSRSSGRSGKSRSDSHVGVSNDRASAVRETRFTRSGIGAVSGESGAARGSVG